jgi:hypothetical protein
MISLSSVQTVPSATSSFWVSCASLQQLFWLREEGREVVYDLSEQQTDGSQPVLWNRNRNRNFLTLGTGTGTGTGPEPEL